MTWQVVRVDTGTWAQTPVASFTSRTLADTCQAHSWLEGEPGECPHARARRLLAAARTEGATP